MFNVQVVSYLLTRQCNMKCSYCGITKHTQGPYPPLKHYYQNEMNTGFVIESLRRFKLHNPDFFAILYGGEPLLRDDLARIVAYCNAVGINYTIITNHSEEIRPKIEKLIQDTGEIKGLTSSVDPLIFKDGKRDDRRRKSEAGISGLMDYKGYIKDLVAEITVDNETIEFLPELVQSLTKDGISSDITVVDTSKSEYYDFSNVTDNSTLVKQTKQVADIFQEIIQSDADVHMKVPLLEEIFNILPSKLDCEIEKGVHNLTIDADGSVRLCLRIRGTESPKKTIKDYLHINGQFDPELHNNLAADKRMYCKGCNWTCMLMSKLLVKGEAETGQLLHSDKRETKDNGG